MPSNIALHPVLRYLPWLSAGTAAAVLLVFSWQINAHSAPWLAGIFMSLALVVTVLRRGWYQREHRSYAVYLAILTWYLLVVWFSHITVPHDNAATMERYVFRWTRILGIGGILHPIAHLHFAISFARIESRIVKVFEYCGWLFSLALVAINLTGNFTPSFTWTGVTWVPHMQGYYVWFFYSTTVLLTAGFLIPVTKLFLTADRAERFQLAYFVVGDIPLGLSCWSNFLISYGINLYPAGGVMFLWHTAVMGYAVLWKRVFDIKIVIRRGLAYAITSVLLGCVSAAGVWSILNSIGGQNPTASIWPTVVIVAIFGLLYAPLSETIQRALDNIFFRGSIDRQTLMARFAREMSVAADSPDVIRLTCQVIHDLTHARRVRLYLLDNRGNVILTADHDGRTKIVTEGVQHSPPGNVDLSKLRQPIVVNCPPEYQGDRSIALIEGNRHLLVPISNRDEYLGAILLDPKRSDDEYTEADIELVASVSAQSSVALSNAHAYAMLARLQHLMRRTLETLPLGVMLADTTGAISLVNPAMVTILGFAEDPKSLTVDQVTNRIPALGNTLQSSIQTGTECKDVEIQLDNGRHCLLGIKVVEGTEKDSERRYVILLHDITEYWQIKEASKRQEQLAEVGEALASYNHEIKNIVYPIMYHVGELKSLSLELPEYRRAMSIIPDRLGALERLLAGLRDLSRPMDLRCRNTDMVDLLDSIADEFRQSRQKANIMIEYDSVAKECFADGQLLRQVVFNLVQNALDAVDCKTDGCVRISTFFSEGCFKISVSDNGCGMSAEQRRMLFQPFKTSKHDAGTGLGLAICRKIVNLHRGQIHVMTEQNVGSTFTVVLPNQTILEHSK